MANGELADFEIDYVREVIEKRDVSDVLSASFMVSMVHKEDASKLKFQRKIVSISKYRFFIFGKAKMVITKAKWILEKDFHLLELKQITGDFKKEISITFSPIASSGSPSTLCLNGNSKALLLSLAENYRQLTYGWPESSKISVQLEKIPKRFNLKADPTEELQNFYIMYKAAVNYTGSENCPHFIQRIQDLMLNKSPQLLLSSIPGADGKGELALNMLSVFMALQSNKTFRSIESRDIAFKDAGDALAILMKRNVNLMMVVVADTEAECSENLGTALFENTQNKIQVLDISSLRFNVSGASSFVKALQHFNHALTVINLENTFGSNVKGTLALMHALQANPGMSLCIKEVNLSHNKFDVEGTEECIRWLSDAGTEGSLRRLSLVNTGININELLIEPILKNLVYLDISENRFDKQAPVNMNAFSAAKKLRQFRASDCNFPYEQLHSFFTTISENKSIRKLALDFSKNDFGSKGVLYFHQQLLTCTRIAELDLSQNNLKTDGGRLVLSGIPSSLTKLNISGNFHPFGFELDEFNAVLSQLLSHCENLTSLNISGKKDRRLGKALVPFFKHLKTNFTLQELDLSNNHMGDSAFSILCRALKQNNSITILNCDKNNITHNGLVELRNLLDFNLTLSSINLLHDAPKDKKELKLFLEIMKMLNSRAPPHPSRNAFKFTRDWSIPKGVKPLQESIPAAILARARSLGAQPIPAPAADESPESSKSEETPDLKTSQDFLEEIEEAEESKIFQLSKAKSMKAAMRTMTLNITSLSPRDRAVSHKTTKEKKEQEKETKTSIRDSGSTGQRSSSDVERKGEGGKFLEKSSPDLLHGSLAHEPEEKRRPIPKRKSTESIARITHALEDKVGGTARLSKTRPVLDLRNIVFHDGSQPPQVPQTARNNLSTPSDRHQRRERVRSVEIKREEMDKFESDLHEMKMAEEKKSFPKRASLKQIDTNESPDLKSNSSTRTKPRQSIEDSKYIVISPRKGSVPAKKPKEESSLRKSAISTSSDSLPSATSTPQFRDNRSVPKRLSKHIPLSADNSPRADKLIDGDSIELDIIAQIEKLEKVILAEEQEEESNPTDTPTKGKVVTSPRSMFLQQEGYVLAHINNVEDV